HRQIFLNGLTSSVDIPNLSPKELKPLLSRANTSLHSSNKHRGLLILQTLVDRCNSEVFESNASNWLSTNASLREKEIACNIIRSVLQIAVEIPNLVSSLLKNFDSSESFLITLTCVLKTFPGSSGSSEKIKKKYLVALEAVIIFPPSDYANVRATFH
ncbi:Proline_ glutamic acid and leucinerich protein 1-like, partial [Caligus rogercresseyi]